MSEAAQAVAKAVEDMAKKKQTKTSKTKSEKKVKAPKAAKTPKAPKAPKAPKEKRERKPRTRVVASGKIIDVIKTGDRYVNLVFETGNVMISPTRNREQNRDIAFTALKAQLLGK